MINFFSRFKFFFAVLGVLSVIIVILFYNALKPEERLPIYQPNMVSATLVDSSMQYVRKYHSIADFKLVNQNGDTITQNTYADKIYVADFFFTTCPSICPVMTANLAEVQDEFKDDNEVLLLSHSVTPEIDSVAQLKKYAVENNQNQQIYLFLFHRQNKKIKSKKITQVNNMVFYRSSYAIHMM